MEDHGSYSSDDSDKEPRIVRIGSSWKNLASEGQIFEESSVSQIADEIGEIYIDPSSWPFEPNQNSEIKIHEDGFLEVTVLQEGSTPGVRSKLPVSLPPGKYVLTVVAFADAESTFFPWVMDSERMRLTPTVHITTQEEPVSVNFSINESTQIIVGVLSHRQEMGDKCFISSIHISRSEQSEPPSSRGNFHSITHSQFVPHQNTTLEQLEAGTRVRSKPISTPGTYAVVDVEPNSIVTLHTKVSVVHPSVAFLYIADSKSGKELIKRDVIMESKEKSTIGDPTEIFSSFDIPNSTSQIRAGILFSTVSEPEEHEMTIHNFELTKFHSLDEIVNESYVLNLEKEIEKYELCKRQGDRLNITLTRWEAIDGETDSIYKDWSRYMEEPWSEMDEKLGRKAIDKPGAWGYLLSMKEIFEDALRKGHEAIAVFDDDFILSKSFDHGFSKLMEIIVDDWQVIYLGASQWLWDDVSTTNFPFYKPDQNTNGSFSVIYRKSVFREIIHNIESMSSPFDAGPLRDVVMGSARGGSFVAYPNLVIANLEKPGIRDSRNQLEFSKRFGWDLQKFPPWFTSWSISPTILRDSSLEGSNLKVRFVTAVTTLNRKEYLESFVNDWKNTTDASPDSTLIVADDGSTDGTLEWLCEDLDIGQSRLVVIRNDGSGIARQSNSIIDFVSQMDPLPSAVFMCNDDIRFLKRGWDDAYFFAMQQSGFDHLVYFNPEWKPPSHAEGSPRFEGLFSSCSARDAMGCFYTLTPELISKIGYFDEVSFPVRGHSHVDYTLRACRVEANDSQYLYDISDSNGYIGMVMRDGYRRTHRILSVNERIVSSSEAALAKREGILLTEGRKFIHRSW